MASSVLLPGFMLWRLKKKEEDSRGSEKKTRSTFCPHLSPVSPPYAATHIQMCFIIMFCATARMIHHEEVLRGSRWRRGGAHTRHPSSLPTSFLSSVHFVFTSHVSVRVAAYGWGARSPPPGSGRKTQRAKVWSEPSSECGQNMDFYHSLVGSSPLIYQNVRFQTTLVNSTGKHSICIQTYWGPWDCSHQQRMFAE